MDIDRLYMWTFILFCYACDMMIPMIMLCFMDLDDLDDGIYSIMVICIDMMVYDTMM